jgi:RNA polymerase sigma-70 factor (family 1)
VSNQKPYTAEEALVLSLQKGEEDGFNYCFEQFYGPLCFFAKRLVNDAQVSEEIAGDSLLKLWERRGRFSHIKSIKAFLYRTTRNSCLNYLKQFKIILKKEKSFYDFTESVEEFILNEMIRTEVLKEIHQAIENLPLQCGKIFRLSYLEGLKNEQIAQQLLLSVHTVKNQKAKALKLLKQKLLKESI